MHIKMQMTMVPMVVTYTSALANYCNVVHQRFPQGSTIKKTNRRVQSSNTSRSSRNNRSGRGNQGGHGGRGRGGGRRNDDWDVIGLDGKTIHVHPAYQFDNDQCFNIPEETR